MLKIIDVMLKNEPYYNFFIGNNFVNYAEPTTKFFDLVVRLSVTVYRFKVSSCLCQKNNLF